MATPFRKITISILALAGAVFGQQPSSEPAPHYARAYYSKWKPGMAQEGQAFLKDVASKATLNWLRADPKAVGQVTMTRVLPGGSEISHDRLRLVITTTPPDLGGGGSNPGAPQFVQAAGMAPAEYSAKLGSFMYTTRSEVWRSEYRHGSIQQGDFVQVQRLKVPARKRAALHRYSLDWEGTMRAQIVKDQGARGLESWTVPLASEEDPFYVSLVVRADSPSIFQGFGGREQNFRKAHPSKDYHAYRQVADEAFEGTVVVESVVYRVDLVAWK